MAEFKLGRLRFVWQGAWTTGTAYVKDDIVRFGGTSYVCVSAHTANSDFYVDRDATRWEVMTAGIQYKTAEWTTGTSYAENDIVRYGGRVYISLDGHVSGVDFFEDKDLGKWNLFVDGVQWKTSPWITAALYKEGDLVRNGGRVYICVDGHIAGPNFETDFNSNKWQLFADGTQWVNGWTANSLYKVGDVVRVSGKTYICVNEHTADATQRGGFYNDIANWNLYADGNTFRGAWDTTSYYWVGDIVRYGAKSYVAVTGHEASADFYTDVDAPNNHWTLLNDGQQWLNEWTAETLYKEGDVVRHGGRIYICVNGHTSNADANLGFDTDLANQEWNLFSDGIQWKNTWTTGTYYKLNDIVRYGAKAFICVTAHQADADFNSNVDSGYWEMLVDGQEWKTSPWQIGTLYKEGDLVRYGGRVYICVNGHTSTSNANRFDLDFAAGEWQLFADGTQWAASWVSTSYYKIGDIVKFGGKTYVAIADHQATNVANQGFYTDLTANKWQLYTDGTEWKGDWQLNTYYKIGDIVRYDGNTYVCAVGHQSADTIEEGLEADLIPGSEKWSIFSEGFKFKGTWNTATKYNVNDVVKFGGSLYICVSYHTSETAFEEVHWNILIGGLEFEDTWASNVEYQIGDIVTYGGYSYVAQTRNTGKLPPGFPADWELLTTGFKVTGEWSSNSSYKVGEVVNYGGGTYVAKVEAGPGQAPIVVDADAESPTFGQAIVSPIWEIVAQGFKWRGTWDAWDVQPDPLADPPVAGIPRSYRVGDTIRWVANSYICIFDHTASEDSVNQPDLDTVGKYWQTIAEGAEGNVLARRGDIVTRDATQNKRLPRGLPGQVLQVSGKDVVWDYFNIVDNVYYVTTDGIDSPERGTTLQTPFRTIKYATEYIQADLANRSPATIYVKTGSYYEELPISVPRYVAIVGDELRSTRIQPAAGKGVASVTVTSGGAGYVSAPTVTFSAPQIQGGVTAQGVAVLGTGGNAGKVVSITITKAGSGYTSAPLVTFSSGSAAATAVLKTKLYSQTNMFYLRDATGLRNMTLQGLDVTLGAPNQYLTRRPSTDCAYVSLDPGTGPGDESTWITTRSPYVQNVTTYGSGAVGMKVDGAIHNGGYKTMVCNDFTQVISDGIGIWCTNQGRVEAVSVFTYYAHLGYIAEDGGVIRGTNGNCSYGTFGVTAEGVDPSEVSRIARVNNRKEEAAVVATFTDGEGIIHLEYSNAGENYQVGNTTYTFDGNGVAGSIVVNTPVVRDGGIKEVRVMNAGKDWLAVVNNAQDGTEYTIRISASDVQVTDAYKGERVVIIDGQGVGQHGYVTHFNGGTKVATIAKESFTPLKITAASVTNNRFTTANTATITAGDAIGFDFEDVAIIASATTAGTNIITVNDSTKLAIGMPIVFSGTVFGNIVANTTYFVKTIVNKTEIKISATNGGLEFSLATNTGAMSGVAGGLFGGIDGEGTIYYVRQVISGTEFTISTAVGGPEVNLATANGLMSLYKAGFESFYNQPIETLLDTTTRYTVEPRVVFSTGIDATATAEISDGVDTITPSSNGGHFQAAPTVIISGTEIDAAGATATATISGSVESVRIRESGSGYTTQPNVQFVGGGLADDSPNHATGIANITGRITSVAVTAGGTGYSNPPMVQVTGGNGDAYISAKITKIVGEVTVNNAGSNYTTVPTVTFSGGGGSGAEAIANLDAIVTGFTILEGGSGYTSATTTVTIVPAAGDNTGSGAEAEVVIDNGAVGGPGVITGISLKTITVEGNPVVLNGAGYTKPPVVIIESSGVGTGAEIVSLISGSIASVTVVNGGSGYSSSPNVAFSSGSAQAVATITGSVNAVEIVNGGSGFNGSATLTFVPVSDFVYNESTCSRDINLIVQAVTADMVFGTNVQSTTAGRAYLRAYSSVVLDTQKTETVAAINKVRDLVLAETADVTARNRITSNFGYITGIISNGISGVPVLQYPTPSNVAQTTVYASTVLRANRSFIQDEVTAWIDYQIANATSGSIWENFTYDSVTCARDVGYLVDALAYDVLYGGNTQSKEFGLSYYEGTNGVIPGQKDQSIAAYTYLRSIVDNIIVEDTAGWTKYTTSNQVISGNPGDSADGLTVQGLIDNVNDIITDGSLSVATVDPIWANGDINNAIRTAINSEIPTIQTTVIDWINATYVGDNAAAVAVVSNVVESVSIVSAGTGYTSVPTVSISGGNGSGALGTVILNASVTNVAVTAPGKNYTTTPTVAFTSGHNFKSVFAGLAYYKNASSQIAISNLQIKETLAAIEYIKDLALAISTNSATQFEYQSLLNRTGTALAPAGAYDQTVFWIDVIKALAENGASNSLAAGIIQSNRAFIIEELSAYANINHSAITYTDADLRKRVGILVDSIIYDLINGTVERTVSLGQSYAKFYSANPTESVELVTFMNDLMQKIILNVIIAKINSAVPAVDQVFAELVAAEITAPKAVLNCTNLLKTIINLNLVLGNSGNSTYTDLLVDNTSWIQAEVIEYIKSNFVYFEYDQTKCQRDTGLILDAVGMDIALGTNYNSVTAGLAYQRANAGKVKQKQIAKTISAINFARDSVVALTGVAASPTAVTRATTNFNEIVDILRYGVTNADVLTFPAPTGVAQDLIDAKDQLVQNRAFLQAEVVAFVDSNSPPAGIDTSVCGRDTGYIVDALCYDILYGGNSAIIQAATAYFYGTNAVISRDYEITKTVEAYNHLKTVIRSVIKGIAVTPTTGNTETQITTGGVATDTEADSIDNLITIINNAIENDGVVPATTLPSVLWTDADLQTAKTAIGTAKNIIITNTINDINSNGNFDYNEELCARDVGLIVDAIAHDVRFAQDAIPVASATTTKVLSDIVVYNGGEGYGQGTTVTFSGDLGTGGLENQPAATPVITDGVITGFTITKAGKGFTDAPSVSIVADTGSGAYARAYVLGALVQQIRIIHPGSGYNAPPYVKLVDPNNTLPGRFEVRISNGVLDQPVFTSRGTAYLAAATSISSPTGYADTYQVGEFIYVQNLTNIPTPGANIQFEGNSQFYKLVTIRDLQGPIGLNGGRSLITANKAFIQRQVIAYINNQYPLLDYNEDLCFRDVGLIIDAIVADIFGDTERGIEAGKAYYRNASGLASITGDQLTATLDAIDQIQSYIEDVVQNIDVERNQLFELQVKEPGITQGSDAINPMRNTLDIIRDIIQNGDNIYAVQDLLLDNKTYIQAEVMAFINTTYPELGYNQDLCYRDVGLIVDALAYDLFAGLGANGIAPVSGLSRSREAGLRYYSNASAQIAITTQKAETIAAIQHIADVAIAVVNNIAPTVVYQSAVPRISSPGVNASLTLEGRIQDGIDEIVNIIDNGLSVLPTGTYAARLQVSPPFTVDNVPNHNAQITIRSKYSQVRLTNHDFLNVGTGNKNESNYPGVPVNAPEPENQVLEEGGGRCFYTSTDQDGNFRVGELFAVEQATGIATLNADAFNLSGLNELSLGGINIGGTGATITEFSTDSLFFANSDSIVPTQKAIKTYIASQLGSGGGNLAVNAITAGDVAVTGNAISTNYPSGLDLIVPNGIFVTETLASTSPTTGSLVVDGGVGIADDVNIGGSVGVGADLVVEGNLTVNGTQTTLNVGTLSVEDTNITIAKDAVDGAAADGAGITVNGPVEAATITYASADDSWNLNKAVKADSIQNTPIGSSTRSTAAFTTLAANNDVTFTKGTGSTGSNNGTVVVTGGVGVSENLNVGGTVGTVGLQASGSVTLSPANASVQVNPSGTGGVVISPTGSAGLTINSTAVGTINNVNIGGTTRGSAKFTTLETNGDVLITSATAATSTDTGALQVDGGAGINGALYAGSIQNTPIGSTTANTGRFTTGVFTDSTASTSVSTGAVTIAGGLGVSGALWAGSINVGGGGIDNTPIGDTTRSTGKFTSLAANGAVTFTQNTTSTSTTTGTLVVTGGVGISENINVGGNAVITGNLTVNGTTTTVNSTTITVDDKNIELGSVASPTDTTADGGGITLLGTSNKTLTWVQSTGYWTFNQPVQASSIQNTAIGSSTANTGAFTSLTANAAVTFTQNTASTTTGTGTLVVTGGVGVSGQVTATTLSGNHTGGSGSFTTLGASSTVTLSPANASVTVSPSGTGTVTINPATAGTMNNVAIGGSTRAAGAFTTLSANSTFSLTDTTDSSTTSTGALVVSGGIGVAKNIVMGGTLVNGQMEVKSGGYAMSVGANIRELFRVPSSNLCTSGIFSISWTRNAVVHNSTWAWSSSHSTTGSLTQLTGTNYTQVPFYLDVASDGSMIMCVLMGSATEGQSYNITVQKYTGGTLSFTNQNTVYDTVASSYTRMYSYTTVANGFQTNIAKFNGGTTSTSTTTGTVIVTGGVGVSENLYTGGVVRFTNNTASTTTGTGALVVTGGVGVGGQLTATTVVETSSIAYKEDINPITDALDAIMQLVGVTYARKDTHKYEAGLIAEEVNKVLPNLVSKNEEGNPEGIQYTKLTAYLIEAVKSLKAEIDQLKGNK